MGAFTAHPSPDHTSESNVIGLQWILVSYCSLFSPSFLFSVVHIILKYNQTQELIVNSTLAKVKLLSFTFSSLYVSLSPQWDRLIKRGNKKIGIIKFAKKFTMCAYL